jgi:chromosome segregation ATPase
LLKHKVEETEATLKSLLKLWEELKQMSDKIRRELQDALDMYNFEAETDAIEAMVREKEYMSNVSDIGKDLEHCKDLQHKLTEENTDMNIKEKIKRILSSAETVRSNKSEEAQKAIEKLENVVLKWNSIQDCINNYKKTLNQARTAHQLVSDMNDVIDIVSEKRKMLVADENLKL